MNIGGYEIERKFLIEYPDMEKLNDLADKTEIVQTYLLSTQPKCSARVRKRGINGEYVYTRTVKTRISDIRRAEDEREISREEYELLLKSADPERNTVYKDRYCLPYKGQLFEIDIYPFWKDRAVLELELEDEKQAIDFPPWICVIRELSADKRYTNSSIARRIPDDEIQARHV